MGLCRDRVAGIAVRYGLDGTGIECQWRRDFTHHSRPALGHTQPPIQLYLVSFRGVKQPERGVGHPPPSSAKVKERVELNFYSLHGLF